MISMNDGECLASDLSRGYLGFGDKPLTPSIHSREVFSLSRHIFRIGDVPDSNGPIVATTGDPFSVWGKVDAKSSPIALPNKVSGRDIVLRHRVVVATDRNPLLIW